MSQAVDERRFKFTTVQSDSICCMLKIGKFEVERNGLPDDTEFVSVHYDFITDTWAAKIASMEYPKVENGCVIQFVPETITIRRWL